MIRHNHLYKSIVLASITTLSACSLQNTKLTQDGADSTKQYTEPALTSFEQQLLLNCDISDQEYTAFVALQDMDVWERIRSGYQLPMISHPRVIKQLAWYSKHPAYLQRVTERAKPYMHYIVEQLHERNMPMELALLPIVESAFDPFAYSHQRASGMWQIIPGTGKMLGLKQNWWYDGRRDIVASTDAALDYLEKLHDRFDGDWLKALAAYNSGGGNVSRAIKRNKKKGLSTDYFSLDLPRETEAYVPRLMALAELIQHPSDYGLTLHDIPNKPYFELVSIGSQIDLAQAAKMAGVNMDELYLLNPGFNRWATDPTGPHTLLVPYGSALTLEEQLATIPLEQRITWDRYVIKRGDTLSGIARKYKLSVESLKTINKLSSANIRVGKTLMVPKATFTPDHYSLSIGQRTAKKYNTVAKTQKGTSVSHKVKSGETLWSISRKYNVGMKKLARWNSMGTKDPLRVGQKLKVWTKAPVTASVSPSTTSQGVVKKLNYRVRSGDTLSGIANKFSLSVSDIMKWNKLSKSSYLHPNQQLTLFVDVTQGS